MALPLEGVRILDFTNFIPGQIPTLLLAEMGADVIKIERHGVRENVYRVYHGGKDPSAKDMKRWRAVNAFDRSKRSLVLNLKSDEGREIFYRLAKKSDVVIEGNRPGSMKRLGVDYDTVRQLHPKIIYCAVTGYGQDGPYSAFPGHDATFAAASGVLSVLNGGGFPPIMPGLKIADLAGAMYATIGILLSLIAREKSGRGQFVDIAMVDAALSWLIGPLIRYFEDGQVQPEKGEVLLDGKRPAYNIYRTKDDKYLCLALREPHLWGKLCRKLGREDLIPFQNPEGEKLEEVIAVLGRIFSSKNRNEWMEELQDVSANTVSRFDDVVSDRQINHREMFVDVTTPGVGTFKQIACPIKLSETSPQVKNSAPEPGQDTESILKELGYSQTDVERLYASRIVE